MTVSTIYQHMKLVWSNENFSSICRERTSCNASLIEVSLLYLDIHHRRNLPSWLSRLELVFVDLWNQLHISLKTNSMERNDNNYSSTLLDFSRTLSFLLIQSSSASHLDLDLSVPLVFTNVCFRRWNCVFPFRINNSSPYETKVNPNLNSPNIRLWTIFSDVFLSHCIILIYYWCPKFWIFRTFKQIQLLYHDPSLIYFGNSFYDQ